MTRSSTEEQIKAIMKTELYRSGEEFTLPDMLFKIPSVKCRYRMNTVLTEMYSRCLLDKRKEAGPMKYRRPMARLLRKRWISEVAEDLCDGDNPRAFTGQAARDVVYRSRALARSGQASCGDSV